ncbi:MAG: hypothetical protein EOP50_02970 [Sphingobacteriales bacterium]|nr:MAG: hypothetical protein EOP50_02970 [Sphingobacteriales bacterium]
MKKALIVITLLTTGITSTTQVFANTTTVAAAANVPQNVLSAYAELEAQFAAEGKTLVNPVWTRNQNMYTVTFTLVDPAAEDSGTCCALSFKGNGQRVF